MDIKQLEDSKLFLLFFASILTTGVGGVLTYLFQKRNWKRQTQLDLYKSKYAEGTKFLDEISELVGKRFFASQKLIWAISDKNNERITRFEKEYFEIINYWNSNYYKNRNKIRLLVNDNRANEFLDFKEKNIDNPRSLHYKFVIAHKKIMEAKDDNINITQAIYMVQDLNSSCSIFLENLTSEFTSKAERLELLDFN